MRIPIVKPPPLEERERGQKCVDDEASDVALHSLPVPRPAFAQPSTGAGTVLRDIRGDDATVDVRLL